VSYYKVANLKIGLAGVPGSGKSKLALAIKNELEKQNEYEEVEIIDGYIDEIEKETDLALGFHGTYIGNMHVAIGREYRDRIARENNDAVITCGTLFETSAYLAQKMEREFSVLEEEDEKYEWNLRVDASMRYISCLYIDTVRYDRIYHLSPLTTDGDADLTVLEKNLQAAFNAFELYPVKRLEADGADLTEITENRVKLVMEDILNANNSKEQNV
jgi:hypothetical protein